MLNVLGGREISFQGFLKFKVAINFAEWARRTLFFVSLKCWRLKIIPRCRIILKEPNIPVVLWQALQQALKNIPGKVAPAAVMLIDI